MADGRPRAGKLEQGRQGRARLAGEGRIAWSRTLLAGRPRTRADLHWEQRGAAQAQLWLVIVDASASTRRYQALSRAKGLLAEVFDQAYRERARLALLSVSGNAPRWQRHGLKASRALQPWLLALEAGGGTPLLAALEQAASWLKARQKNHPAEQQRCLVLTDGRLKAWDALAPLPCESMLVDLESAPVRLGRAQKLAHALGAEYRHIEHFAQM